MRVTIQKSDGRIIESQSGDGGLDALIANAEAAGFGKDDVDVREMDDAEFATLLAAQIATEVGAAALDGFAFLARFTDEEYLAIVAAGQANGQIGKWTEMLRMRGSIDINGKTSQEAKAGLVVAGLLTQKRADEIFAP